MASLNVFCNPSELRDWLVELAIHKEFGILSFGQGACAEFVPVEEFELRDDIYAVFLYPQSETVVRRLTMNDARPREWGWIHVRPGGIHISESRMILLNSEMHGERCERDGCTPDKWVQWLKRRVRKRAHVGVVGKNVVHGGESRYDDFWFTDKASEMFNAGVVWKQNVDGNVIFEPLR